MTSTLSAAAASTQKCPPSGPEDPPPAPAVHRTPGVVWTIIAVGAFTMVAALLGAVQTPVPALWRIGVVLGVFVLGDAAMLHIRFGNDQNSFTMSETALLLGLVLLPLPWMCLIAPPAVATAHLLAHRPPIKVAFNAMSFVCAAALAGTAMNALTPDVLPSFVGTAAGLVAASLIFFAWNTASMAAAVSASQRLSFREVYATGMLLCLLVWLGNTAVGLLLVGMLSSRSPFLVVVPLLLALLYFLYWSYLRAMTERDLWQVLQQTSRELLRVEATEVAHAVLDRTPALFGCEFVELLLVPDESADVALVYRRRSGETTNEVFDSRLHHSNPFWGRMLAEREPFQIIAEESPVAQRNELSSLSLSRCVVAPLLVQDRCLGTLRLGFSTQQRFGDREMQVLTTFANHVSAAVHNTRLFETVRVQALHDPLTGLANRTLLLDRLEAAQRRSRASGRNIAVLFLDLDRFKVINDSMGHEAGDHLLVAVADRIAAALRPGDTAARFGGDEFVVLCENLEGPGEALSIAERLVALLSTPFSLLNQQLFISASVGVAVADDDDDPVTLLRDADAAMYEAKGKGPARCELFDAAMRERAVVRLELENDLRVAIQRHELDVHYQPNVRLRDEGVVGLEALVRWTHPVRGEIAPDEFIPLAEETGLIIPLGAWVIETACRQLADWTRRGCVGAGDLYIAVNLSAHQLAHSGLVSHVAGVLMMTGVSPRSLCLEVTESALLDDLQGAREVLERLRRIGVRIALDDFGTGYSSLSYLQMLPVDMLKLDRSFVARLSPDPRDRAILAGMVDLAHALELTVVAEGVETAEQLADLRAMHCDQVQGFHYFRPQAAKDLDAMLLMDEPLLVSNVTNLVDPEPISALAV